MLERRTRNETWETGHTWILRGAVTSPSSSAFRFIPLVTSESISIGSDILISISKLTVIHQPSKAEPQACPNNCRGTRVCKVQQISHAGIRHFGQDKDLLKLNFKNCDGLAATET